MWKELLQLDMQTAVASKDKIGEGGAGLHGYGVPVSYPEGEEGSFQ